MRGKTQVLYPPIPTYYITISHIKKLAHSHSINSNIHLKI